MKSSNLSKVFLLAALLLVTSFASAETNKGNLSVDRPLVVSGKTLAAGEYTLQWEGSGPAVKVDVLKGKKVVATVPAQVVSTPTPQFGNGISVAKNPDGTEKVTQIQFNGKKYLLQIEDQSAMKAGN